MNFAVLDLDTWGILVFDKEGFLFIENIHNFSKSLALPPIAYSIFSVISYKFDLIIDFFWRTHANFYSYFGEPCFWNIYLPFFAYCAHYFLLKDVNWVHLILSFLAQQYRCY